MRLLLCSLAALVAAAPLRAPLAAQTPTTTASTSTLSLDEALGIARRSNPTYLQSVEQRTRASAQLRSAYGNLLPDLSSSFSTGFRQGKQQFFG